MRRASFLRNWSAPAFASCNRDGKFCLVPRTSKNLTYENISSILNHTTNVDFYIFGRSNEGLKPSSRSKFKICSTFSRNLNRLNKFQLDIERKNKGIKVSYQIARLPSIALKPSANSGQVADMDVSQKGQKRMVRLGQKWNNEKSIFTSSLTLITGAITTEEKSVSHARRLSLVTRRILWAFPTSKREKEQQQTGRNATISKERKIRSKQLKLYPNRLSSLRKRKTKTNHRTGNEHPTEKKVIPVSPPLIEIIRCNTRCTVKAASSTLRPNALPSTSRSRCRCRHRNSAASHGSHRGLITWEVALKNKEVDLDIVKFVAWLIIVTIIIIIIIIIILLLLWSLILLYFNIFCCVSLVFCKQVP